MQPLTITALLAFLTTFTIAHPFPQGSASTCVAQTTCCTNFATGREAYRLAEELKLPLDARQGDIGIGCGTTFEPSNNCGNGSEFPLLCCQGVVDGGYAYGCSPVQSGALGE
ncbi:uncharacterized protein LY89DRAFT_722657 [Mollisia scopiformis]|uniref:Hydrophobin n=1 Tax=Mollisia scopiformis TaxID=149040 RepID=A0A194WV25_MOLSC|nr:uncharacterized protein LY89DRAFT_722657 [Mollisia scopiformis]KUJ11519.1 hypothetical protein LY89DRAFT_722657 [Mollisia scopiformis]